MSGRGRATERKGDLMTSAREPQAETAPGAPGVCITALAELPRDSHLDTAALARMLGRSKKTIARATRRGELPPPVKFLGRHVWLVGTILDHMQARQTAAICQADQRERRRAKNNF